MSRLTARIRRATTIPPQQLLLYGEAFFTVIGGSIAVKLFPQKRIKQVYGTYNHETSTELSEELAKITDDIRDAIYAAQLYLPWEVTCVMQAMSGKWMLNRRNIPSTVYEGFRTKPEKKFDGHAWLRAGKRIVTGAPIHRGFKITAYYGTPEA